jgi:N-sulfoglucosamine sulfohydrolase
LAGRDAIATLAVMNIVYLHSHDTGRYVSPYGFDVPTPHLQAFADEGVTFRQAFSAAPTCSPSRAALLTGRSAHGSGMLGLAHRDRKSVV